MNSNLLQITTIPISIEIKVTNAKYQYPEGKDRQPKVNITSTQGGYVMKADPIKVKIATYEARKSLGYGHMTDGDMMSKKAQDGFSLAFQGTARVASEGNMLARGMTASEIAIQNARAGATVETIMEFLPKEGADITFDGGTLSIDYDMGEQEIVPGSVELIVRDRPRVEIEYLGEPIYFPASANPNYKPPVLDIKG